MNKKKPVILFWSGGKDSSYALYKTLRAGDFDIRFLLSTMNGNNGRLSMHGIREELIDRQAELIGIPLLKMYVHEGTNEEYESVMKTTLKSLLPDIHTAVFGDIFLEDLRAYREKNLAEIGFQCVFPLWKMNTRLLVDDFIKAGFESYTCCVSDAFLSEKWVGRIIDHQFLTELPAMVDPCGENGEFHSFCVSGPVFAKPLGVKIGDKVYKPLELSGSPLGSQTQPKGFWYCDFY